MSRSFFLLLPIAGLLCACHKSNTSKRKAAFTLDATYGPCASYNLKGAYKVGVPLDTSNTVSFQTNINTPGAWSISTTTENGITFSGSGTFDYTGNVMVTLRGIGTPAATGDYILPLVGTDCSIGVVVDDTSRTAVQNAYWPLTYGSWWKWIISIDDKEYVNTVSGTYIFQNRVYKNLSGAGIRKDVSGTYYALLNKTGEYHDLYKDSTGYHNVAIHFQQSAPEYKFLKDALQTGNSLITDIPGTDSSGNAVALRISVNVIGTNETLDLNGTTVTNVYHLELLYQYALNDRYILLFTQPIYFAKGIGMIKSWNNAGYNTVKEWKIQ